MLFYDFRMRSIGMLGDEFGDIINFEIVLYARDQVSCSGWFPAIIVPLFESSAVRLFFFIGEGKNGFGEGELSVDICVAEAVVLDVEESCPYN
jgi:hypothetical protein